MSTTLGILAHVDAGKTTFAEQVLFHTNTIRSAGRVDYKNSFLDTHHLEQERGITIFSDQASFRYEDQDYYLVDTPGHVDFSAEMERAIQIMDYAVVIVSCIDGVRGHTETVFKLLKKYKVPVFIFINKTDRQEANIQATIQEIRQKLTPSAFCADHAFEDTISVELIDFLAEQNDELLDLYLQHGYNKIIWFNTLKKLLLNGEVCPCFSGSALYNNGIDAFLKGFNLLTKHHENKNEQEEFSAKAYKIRYDDKGNRLVFLKILSGILTVKDKVLCKQQDGINEYEKINEIRIYNGAKYKSVSTVSKGDLCAVTGLNSVTIGDQIGFQPSSSIFETTPLLSSKVLFDEKIDAKTVLGYFKKLEDQDPLLSVKWNEPLKEIHIHVMGLIQLEVLKEIVKDTFNLDVAFSDCEILYKETVASEVMGYGHFEPLKHYAEVHLLISPNERNKGITFSSVCKLDELDNNYQNLVKTHVFEKEHKGVLTGSPLTDVHITLVKGRAHIKHTEGGDFREATYRAIRQGLEKAQNMLLEPIYSYCISVEPEFLGRVISDIQKMSGSFEDPIVTEDQAVIKGRVPAATFMNYSTELISFTKGKGSLSYHFDGYEACHNSDEVIEKISYDKSSDKENVSDSVFCSHGAGFNVKWYEAHEYMHIK